MSIERRKFPRIRLNIHAKGVIRADTKFFSYTATAINLSKAGVALKFTEDATIRAKEAIKKGFAFKDAEVMIQLISYIEENIPVTGVASRLAEIEGTVIIAVKLNPVDKRSVLILEKILDMSPNLKEADPKEAAFTKFASFEEFVHELTQLAILTEKKTNFWIGKEKFAFTGMHRDDKGDIHRDCIESVDRPGVIFCPDCRAKILPNQLI